MNRTPRILTVAVTGVATLALAVTACTTTITAPTPLVSSGQTMHGWSLALGDANWAEAGQPPITDADIAMTGDATKSTLNANVNGRQRAMVHAIATTWEDGPITDDRPQAFEIDVRLPYLPQASASAQHNPQTIEMAVNAWNGTAKLDTTCGVQWQLNPYDPNHFEELVVWGPKSDGTGEWQRLAAYPVNTDWLHRKLAINPKADT